MQIDIAMTACLRADVVAKTLQSIYAHTLLTNDQNLHLVINVDPIGPSSYAEIMDVVHSISTGSAMYKGEQPDHVSAFKRVLAHSHSQFVLFWEDDYVLCRHYDLNVLIEKMQSDRSIGMIYLDRKGKSVLTHPPYMSCFAKCEDGQFYERISGKSIGGPPALMRQEYIQSILPHIKGEPDVLSAYNKKVQTLLNRWTHLTYIGNNGSFVEDIGGIWRKENGLKRIKSAFGLEWVKSC